MAGGRVHGIEVGGFAIDRLVGRGGMADVWLGRHRLSGQAGAIKVITRNRADDDWFTEGFRREVRAVAGLDHPGIVPVLDAGTLDADVAAASGGALVAGSPWLAMVYAEHGDMRRLGAPLAWPLLREVLLQILDALAHAHAREVIHRDLKPGNVLLQTDGHDLRLMLTDFGIAHVMDGDDSAPTGGGGTSAGTPEYMAPEQLRSAWRDYGPWTDLYALGCMAFELACGSAPYAGTNPIQIATRHLTGEIPRLEPLSPMPDGFAQWVRRLMARSPWDRFGTAADAAHALSRLDAPDPEATRRARISALRRLKARPDDDHQATVVEPSSFGTGDDVGRAPTLATVLGGPAPAAPDALLATVGLDHTRPPIPETWYVPGPRRPLLRGVGLGLFGVRTQPLVGRDHERNALWDALRRVHARGEAEMVMLAGPEGVGKTALAQWFVRRAREVGAADVMQFRFSAMDVPGDGMNAGFIQWVRGFGLSGAEFEDRVRSELTRRAPRQAKIIADVVAPAMARMVTDTEDDITLSPTERFSAGTQCLTIAATPRPLIVVFDDLQWGEGSLQFLRFALTRGLPAPVLFVATVRSDECGIGPDRRHLVRQLAEVERCSRYDIGVLDDAAHAEVIEELLGLSPRLSQALRRTCSGNPLLATQVITDWVESGALMPTAAGYDMPRDGEIEVPSDLRALALSRLDRIIARFCDPDAALQSLEIAALLGHAICNVEWGRACAALPVEQPCGLNAALHDAGVAVPGRGGWMFGHGFMRSALLDMARGTGRDRAMHRACATAVFRGTVAERRASHLMRAEAFEETIDALLEAAVGRMESSEYTVALTITDHRIDLMDRVGVPPNDIRRAYGRKLRIDALRYSQRLDEARAEYAEFAALDIGPEHRLVLAERAHAWAGLASYGNSHRALFDAYQDAIALYRAAGDRRGEARTLHGLGWSRMAAGMHRRAYALFDRSRAIAEEAGLRLDEGWAWHAMAAARAYAEEQGITPLLDRAAAAFSECGFPLGQALVRAERAEQARQAGDTAAARKHAEAAREIFAAVGSHLIFRAQAALVLIDLDDGRNAEAFAEAQALLDRDGTLELSKLYRAAMGFLVAWAASRVDADDELDRALTIAEAPTERTFVPPGLRPGLVRMAHELETSGRPSAARRAWRLAAAYWRPIDPEKAAEFTARAGG